MRRTTDFVAFYLKSEAYRPEPSNNPHRVIGRPDIFGQRPD